LSSCGLTIESPGWITAEDLRTTNQDRVAETPCPSSGAAARRINGAVKPGLNTSRAGAAGSKKLEGDNDVISWIIRTPEFACALAGFLPLASGHAGALVGSRILGNGKVVTQDYGLSGPVSLEGDPRWIAASHPAGGGVE
jgi:hypothetical protein